MMRTSFGQRGRGSGGRANGTRNSEEGMDSAPQPMSDFEENDAQDGEDDDMDEDEDEEDAFLQQRMPEQHPAIRTTIQLMELMDGDRPYLDLNPHYQRNVVWTRKAKIMLIDSMFGGFFVPPVIFNVTQVVDENGAARYKRTCVDGKQRLTSIRDFMRGQFPWRVGKKNWFYTRPTNEDGSKKRGTKPLLLPDVQRQLFGRKAIVCVEYKDLSQQQEIELFQRVQLGKPLTRAETFRASQGSWQDLAKSFESDYKEVFNLCRQNNRASGFWLVLQCFSQIFECMDPSAANGRPRLKNRVPAIEKLCSDSASLDKTTKNHLRQIFDRLLEMVREDASVFESSQYARGKAFGPIELIAVCSMIAHWGDSRPNGLYRGDIRGLRERLREATVGDLRGSDECWAICWKYIEDLDIIRGTVDGSTTARDGPTRESWSNSTVAVRAGPPSKKTTAPQVPHMLPRGRPPGEADGNYQPTAPGRKPGSTQRRKPAKAPKPNNAAPKDLGRSKSPKPFAGHRPVYNPDDDSSNSSSDDDNLDNGDTPLVPVVPAVQSSSAPRKRPIMELGSGNNAALDLEAKKARLMAGSKIKQEP